MILSLLSFPDMVPQVPSLCDFFMPLIVPIYDPLRFNLNSACTCLAQWVGDCCCKHHSITLPTWHSLQEETGHHTEYSNFQCCIDCQWIPKSNEWASQRQLCSIDQSNCFWYLIQWKKNHRTWEMLEWVAQSWNISHHQNLLATTPWDKYSWNTIPRRFHHWINTVDPS